MERKRREREREGERGREWDIEERGREIDSEI